MGCVLSFFKELFYKKTDDADIKPCSKSSGPLTWDQVNAVFAKNHQKEVDELAKTDPRLRDDLSFAERSRLYMAQRTKDDIYIANQIAHQRQLVKEGKCHLIPIIKPWETYFVPKKIDQTINDKKMPEAPKNKKIRLETEGEVNDKAKKLIESITKGNAVRKSLKEIDEIPSDDDCEESEAIKKLKREDLLKIKRNRDLMKLSFKERNRILQEEEEKEGDTIFSDEAKEGVPDESIPEPFIELCESEEESEICIKSPSKKPNLKIEIYD
jgi:hypothetical protein